MTRKELEELLAKKPDELTQGDIERLDWIHRIQEFCADDAQMAERLIFSDDESHPDCDEVTVEGDPFIRFSY